MKSTREGILRIYSHRIIFLMGFIMIIISGCLNAQQKNLPAYIKSIITRGDINSSTISDTVELGRYQGNGRFGCIYGKSGLHVRTGDTVMSTVHGKTQFMHMEHFVRGKFAQDYLIPLAKIYWDYDFKNIENYKQRQSFYNGTITTNFNYDNDSEISITTWFSPINRNLAGIIINVKGICPSLIIAPLRELDLIYQQEMDQSFTDSLNNNVWKANITCREASTDFIVKSNAEMVRIKKGLRINLKNGRNDIIISVNEPVNTLAENSLKQTKEWWHSSWNNMGWIDLPDDHAQKMWVRSLAYILSSYNDDGIGMSGPMGLTGIGWPFSFPQDLSFIHPVLLSINKIDIAKSWIEYWAKHLEDMKKYTQRLFKVSGIFCPWTYPYGSFNGFQDPLRPNTYHQIHNSGYLCRMANETAIMVNDAEWTKKYAIPLIKETALFYKNICKKENDGFWHIHVIPSLGQDEDGGVNQKDYLGALFSTQYCFQTAIAHGLDQDGSIQNILDDGLAFPTLLMKNGIYKTNQGSGKKDFGKQKTGVQLNPLAYLPIYNKPGNPEKTAYKLRYKYNEEANIPMFWAWTLEEFLLAGSRIHDEKGWQKDWDNILKSQKTDPDWIQIYESSKLYRSAFFITGHGLVVQSLINNLVSTWWGHLDIAPCIPWSGDIRFGNIRSLLGVTVSGKISDNQARVTLDAWKDTSFECYNRKITLKKGEKTFIVIPLYKE